MGMSLLLLLDTCWQSHQRGQGALVLGPALPRAHCDCGQVPTPLDPVSFPV